MLQTERVYSNAGRIDDANGSIINTLSKMEKGLKIWQAVMATIGILITGGTILVNQSNKIETQRLRIEFLETDARDKSLQIKDLNQQQTQQYKEISAKLTDILVSLQNKANKK
jgi:hypothetical protein